MSSNPSTVEYAWGVVLGLHILMAAVWVGGMAFMNFALRPSLAVLETGPRGLLLNQVWRRFFLIVWHAMPLSLITGYAMLFGIYGGFAGAAWNINAMHGLALIMAIIFLVVVFGPWKTFRRTTDRARAAAAASRIRTLVLADLVLGVITIVLAALPG
jgi:uncharacterized membrane protein